MALADILSNIYPSNCMQSVNSNSIDEDWHRHNVTYVLTSSTLFYTPKTLWSCSLASHAVVLKFEPRMALANILSYIYTRSDRNVEWGAVHTSSATGFSCARTRIYSKVSTETNRAKVMFNLPFLVNKSSDLSEIFLQHSWKGSETDYIFIKIINIV